MSKQIAQNVFTNGLQMDLHPLSSQNTVLTNALNATLITVDGDEMILQNDLGNLKIKDTKGDYVKLTEGFIPIGVKSFNGIAYIVSYNPTTKEGEIGTYPSPKYVVSSDNILIRDFSESDKNILVDQYNPLYTLYKGPVEYNGEVYDLEQESIRRVLHPLRTKLFNFDLEHPVNIEVQKSYDGSVNLILNDGLNIPRLINSRFSVLQDNKVEIPQRRRNTDNICKEDAFDITTSLHKRISSFPVVKYNGVLDTGDLPVGNYVLYFKYCDEDENETDFIAESGIISIFKGKDSDPFSIDGGERDMNANKSINVTLQLIDNSYSYVKVYYSRTSAAADENRITSAYQIYKSYPIEGDECNIIITGNEEKTQIPLTDLNQQYTIINSAKTQAQVDNMLFLGNVEEQDINYKKLTNLSLHVIPYVEKQESKNKIGYISCQSYTDTSGINPSEERHIFKGEYYNTKNIYYNVGYWNEEFYRLGIVYIYKDGSLSPVFNILGYESSDLVRKNEVYQKFNFNDEAFNIDSDGYITNGITATLTEELNITNLNSNGIIKINDKNIEYRENKDWLYNIGVYIPNDLIDKLKELNIQGFFIVRQKRIPTILAQGYTLPWDKESKVPIVEYIGKSLPYGDSHREQPIDYDWNYWNDYRSYLNNYNETALYKENGENNFIWHKMYFVESFIYQVGKEGENLRDPVEKESPYQRVSNNYIPRLHNILPLCIDHPMCTSEQNSLEGYSTIKSNDSNSNSNNNYYFTDTRVDRINYYILQTVPKILEDNSIKTLYSYDELFNLLLTYYVPENDNEDENTKRTNIENAINNGTVITIHAGGGSNTTFTIKIKKDISGTYYIEAPGNEENIPFSVEKSDDVDSYYANAALFSEGANSQSDVRSDVYAVDVHFQNLYKYCDENQLTAICPEFEVRQPFFNQLFTGTSFIVKYSQYQQGVLTRNPFNDRYYYPIFPEGYEKNILINSDIQNGFKLIDNSDLREFVCNKYFNYTNFLSYKIVGVTENVPIVAIDNTIFKGVCGDTQEAYRFEYINEEHSANRGISWEYDRDFNFVRGVYTPYLGIVSQTINNKTEKQRGYCRTFNIYADNVKNSFRENYKIRKQNNSAYYSISEKISFDVDYTNYIPELNKWNSKNGGYFYDLYRGDCFLCTFTHRLNRNFSDPTAPSNDKIANVATWRKYYELAKSSNFEENIQKINRGDINAVKLGSWITIKVKSSYNLSIRSLDERYLEEKATMGRARGFYPLQQASAEGGYKIPNSYLINDGFGSTVGEKIYNTLPEAPYYNNQYQNRIVYSDVNINNSYKNNYRIFRSINMRDYTKQYGAITKMLEWYGDLICVFEHGIAYIPVKERMLVANGTGGGVFVTNNDVLPETPKILSDKFGSQYADSIIATPYYIYGVDTSTQKIWKTNGGEQGIVQIISDMKVESFLKTYMNIKETEYSVKVGIKNVKTQYNPTKSDLLFTFYNKVGEDEIAWNLCLNEIQSSEDSGQFITFYSWIPLDSFTINNIWHSFDREIVRDYIINPPEEEKKSPSLYIWRHNNANNRPLPTHWYGKQHPFEFEFIVLDNPMQHKIFENLQIISNNAEPESFHFEITGDVYDFKEDLPNMYYRQECTKKLYHNLGSHWTYDDYQKIHPNWNIKSTIFPLYYERKDEYDQIYDNYQQMTGVDRNYQNLSGSEVVWYKRENKFGISTHIKNLPINGHWVRDYSTEESLGKTKKEIKPKEAFLEDNDYIWTYKWEPGGILRGNSQYDKDKWSIQIPSITFMQKNESKWEEPPIILNSIPKDIQQDVITYESLPNTYSLGQVLENINDQNSLLFNSVKKPVGWTNRKEVKIQDKYCRIKIRYSGEELAIILAVLTIFNTK